MQKILSVKKLCVFILIELFLSLNVFSQNSKTQLEELTEKATEICKKLNIGAIKDALFSDIISFFRIIAGSFGICICVIIIASVFAIFKTSLSANYNITECITSTLLILYCYRIFDICFDKIQSHLSSLCALMLSFVPIQTALLASGGATVTSGVFSSAGSFSISLIEIISCSLVIPLIKVSFTINTVNVLCKDMNFSGIGTFIKSLTLWIIGLSFTLLSGVFALQSALSTSSDTLTLKGIRFGATRLIPVAGSFIGESLRTVLSSVSYIKSITGVSGIVLLIYSTIPPLSAIIVTKLFFSFLGAISKVANTKQISSFLESTSSLLNVLSALLIGCVTAFIAMLTIFLKCTVIL